MGLPNPLWSNGTSLPVTYAGHISLCNLYWSINYIGDRSSRVVDVVPAPHDRDLLRSRVTLVAGPSR